MATSNAQSAQKGSGQDTPADERGGSDERASLADGPQTCCSTCLTVFQVSPELLESVDTRVRCGECYAIFDALANLVDDAEQRSSRGADADGMPERTGIASAVGRAVSGATREADDRADAGAASLAGLANDTAALDVTYSDFDLFSEDAELPEVAYFDQTRDTPEFDFDSVDLDDDETFSDTLFVNDVTLDARTGDATPLDPPALDAARDADDRALPAPSTVVDGTSDEGSGEPPVRAPLEFRYRDPEPSEDEIAVESARRGAAAGDVTVLGPDDVSGATPEPLLIESPRGSSGSWSLRLLMLLLFVTLLGALYGYRQRDALADDPFTRPVYTAWCRATGCTVPPRAALDRIQLIKRDVFTHPDLEDALVIAVAFRNTAPFEQAYPALVVRLSDPSGRLVARRAFEPSEYLSAGAERASVEEGTGTIAAGARLDISLDVSDPGQNATSFEVDFVAAR